MIEKKSITQITACCSSNKMSSGKKNYIDEDGYIYVEGKSLIW